MKKQGAAALIAGAMILALTACTSEGGAPEVTPAPAAAESAESTPSPTPEAVTTVGTRQAPLAIGEARRIADDSMWTVSLTSSNLDAWPAIHAQDEYAVPPADGETFVVGTFSVAADATAYAEQGGDMANDGAQPWGSLQFEYVSADGASFSGLTGTMCYTGNQLGAQGPVYEDGAVVTGDVCVAVPSDKVAGGLWRISNSVNDSVWIAAS